MTAATIIPAAGLARLVDGLIEAVRIGVRRFWRGGAYANAPAGQANALLNRLMRILRCAFVILAVHVVVPPLRPRRAGAAPPQRARLRRPAFHLFAHSGIGDADAPKHPQPAAFAASRDRFLTAQRKLDALTRALGNPMPLVRRMARALPTRLMVFGWRPPKRPPPADKRDFWDELIQGFTEARFHLSAWRRRTGDSAGSASGSGGSGDPKACADG